VSAARSATRAAGHESAGLEELHKTLAPARQQLREDQIQEAIDDPTSFSDGDVGGDDGGIIDGILDWIGDLF
jgi:hypothetical protein